MASFSAYLACLLLPLSSALACVNDPSTDLNGKQARHSVLGDTHNLLFSLDRKIPLAPPVYHTEPPASLAKKLEAEALTLIYAGNYSAALPLLQNAEATAPGDYSIAANLGTTLELLGDNAAALNWITEAVRRNPESHRGTEWVHVLVLEAKLRDAGAPGSSLRQPLVAIPEHIQPDTRLAVAGTLRSAASIREALNYQLTERMTFVKPKDPYVADLLYSLAVLEANLASVESARIVLSLAERYGYRDTARIQHLRDAIDRALWISRSWLIAKWTGALSLFVAALYYACRRKWLFLTRRAYRAHKESLKNP